MVSDDARGGVGYFRISSSQSGLEHRALASDIGLAMVLVHIPTHQRSVQFWVDA